MPRTNGNVGTASKASGARGGAGGSVVDPASAASSTIAVLKSGRYKTEDGVTVTLDKRRLGRGIAGAAAIPDPTSLPAPETQTADCTMLTTAATPPVTFYILNSDSFEAARWLLSTRPLRGVCDDGCGCGIPKGPGSLDAAKGCCAATTADGAGDCHQPVAAPERSRTSAGESVGASASASSDSTVETAPCPRRRVPRGGDQGARIRASRDTVGPLVLDFASDSNPGGGWRGGQRGTQEEALCRCSSLGVTLERVYNAVGAAAYVSAVSRVPIEWLASPSELYSPECIWV
jgi:hypothetical protein